MKKITLKFDSEDKFNRFRFMLETGCSVLTKHYEKNNQLDQSLGVRQHYAEVWQQIEEQKNAAE